MAPTDSVKAYRASEEDWRRRARSAGGAIVVGIGLFLILAFVLETVANGPEPLEPSSPQTFAALREAVDALASLSRGDGLMLVITLLTAEAGLAIALSATDIDRSAVPHVAVDTERWLQALSASVRLLAISACLIALGTVIDVVRQRTLPDGAVLILIVAMIAALLASAMVDRTSALLGQIGLRAQLSRLDEALDRLGMVTGGYTAPVLRLGLPPIAFVLAWITVSEGMRSGVVEAATRAGASVALVGTAGFFLVSCPPFLGPHRSWLLETMRVDVEASDGGC